MLDLNYNYFLLVAPPSAKRQPKEKVPRTTQPRPKKPRKPKNAQPQQTEMTAVTGGAQDPSQYSGTVPGSGAIPGTGPVYNNKITSGILCFN